MTEAYRVRGETPSRTPSVPCRLRPPLREIWRLQYTGIYDVTSLPLVDSGRIFYKLPGNGHLSSAVEGTRTEVWTYPMVAKPSVLSDGVLFTWPEFDRVHILDPMSGQLVRVVDCPVAQQVFVVNGTMVILANTRRGQILAAVDVTSGSEVWRVRSGDSSAFEGFFCVSGDRVVVGHGNLDLASSDQAVVAVSLLEGEEIWRHKVADLIWDDVGKVRPGRVGGTLVAHEDVILVNVVQHFVLGLSRADGRRLWVWKAPHGAVWQGYLYDGRYYVIAGFGTYHVLDPMTGRVLVERDLQATLPAELRPFNPHSPLLISETHAFTGSLGPYLLAFDRDSGEYAWSHKPDGAGTSQGQYFMSVNGRFYYGDGALRIYCLEEVDPTDPVLARQRREQGSG